MEHDTPNLDDTPYYLLRDYLDKDAAAAALGIAPYTLKRWRMRGYGPQAVKVGGRLRWRVRDIESWLDGLGDKRKEARQ